MGETVQSRKRRVEWEMEEEEKKKAAAARGEDYERIKYKDMSAMEADRRDRKKAKKAAGKDAGFTTYAAASYRQYERLTKQMKPDVRAYKKSQDEWGDDSTEAGSLAYGQHDRVSGEGTRWEYSLLVISTNVEDTAEVLRPSA